ncbi:iron ABC transporter permease [Halolactibacillus miurensis]|uniref:Iron ABC transporter permease n=1 Tax=Halolactibacillus miurensis TaxID=306541 RepID=A0A1I6P5V1_9BACI|nr:MULTISPECIES: iron ABC transporter permease [Halolactibacillus]GEM03098.1 iron ABC transporter permease [Halolactibacillus miurensis]SFS35603.1 iron complex transport system permease protein [Halolactibacillus miurensis]
MNKQRIIKQRIFLVIFALLLVSTMLIAINAGTAKIPINRVIQTFLNNGSFNEQFIIFKLRLPRIFITVLAGMGLSLSGAILQSLTRNDLADPGLIGINAGAGVSISLLFLFIPLEPGLFTYIVPLVGMLGGMLTAVLIYLFSYERHRPLKPLRLILTGVGVSTALSGLMVVIISSAQREKVDFIAKWLAGNIWGTDWPFVYALLPWLIVFVPLTFIKAQKLNILSLSEGVAIGLGVAIKKERLLLLLSAVTLAASSVAVTGGISFIGLMSPHMAKRLVGQRHQLFLPLTMLIGGWLLLVADTLGRSLINTIIPAGIIVSIIGAPYFIYLLLRDVD